MKRLALWGAVLLQGVALSWAGEIEFVETFALAPDRDAALKQLIPGTEDYYYWNALHLLNTEQFEGGELRFPEFGNQLYRPETGAGIVFSSSLLHEPLHVTGGRRFVLLCFLY